MKYGLFRCHKCGKEVFGQYKESPNLGSYASIKCKCGEKDNTNIYGWKTTDKFDFIRWQTNEENKRRGDK